MRLKRALIGSISLLMFLPTTSVLASDGNTKNINTERYDVKVYDANALKSIRGKSIGTLEYNSSEILNKVEDISVKQILSINNVNVPLYPVFENSEVAIQNIKEKSRNVLDTISKNSGLEELNDNNWKAYLSIMNEMLDSPNKPDWYTEDNEEFILLDSFFDIYENNEENEELISMAYNSNSVDELFQNSDFLNTLSWKYSEEFGEKVAESIDKNLSDYQNRIQPRSYSLTKAVNYAKKYAKNSNSDVYGYISGADCTNFTSQILHEGGYSYNINWKCYKLLGKRHYTKIWCNANKFVNYWKVDYKYTSHNSFANKLQKGDFITYDGQNDGDWDHNAFVTAIGSKTSSGYKNYQVAQHTNNYLAWASNTKTCGWATVKTRHPKAVLGIVRIS